LAAIHPSRIEGISLRQAAVIAGFGYLLMPVSYAEFNLYPKVVISGNIEQTVQNIAAHGRLFLAAAFCYLVTFLLDVVIAWALYILLAPVNRALSLLGAWFRLVYAVIGLFGLFNLFTVYNLVTGPDYLASFGAAPLHVQVKLLLASYRYDWNISLAIFGIHLVLIGWLIFRSTYIPRVIGILLVVDGVGWVVSSLQPYLYPSAHLGWIFVTYFGELIFMLWLLIRGWKITEPAQVEPVAPLPA
jgi:hypothetical protein